jgi:hypothetical protein
VETICFAIVYGQPWERCLLSYFFFIICPKHLKFKRRRRKQFN